MWRWLVAILVTVAALIDFRFHKVPNWFIVAGVLSGIIIHTTNTGWTGFLFSLQGMTAGLLFLLTLFATGWGISAHKVKILAVIGALGGTGFVAGSALGMLLVVAILVLWVIFRRRPLKVLQFSNSRYYIDSRGMDHTYFPYGFALALGTYITLSVW